MTEPMPSTLLRRFLNTSDCLILIEEVFDPTLEVWVIFAFAMLYSTMFMLGVTGNVSVIYCTLKNQRLQSVQNLFILNLSIADLLICLFSMPLTPVTNILKNWLFGAEMCVGLPLIQGTAILSATFSLIAIAIDRYHMIVNPHAPMKKRIAKPLMLTTWILSIVFTVPYAMHMELVEYHDSVKYCGKFCTESWPSDRAQTVFTASFLIVQYLVPFVIIAFCYCRIFQQLKKRTEEKIKRYNERSLVLFASAGIMSAVGHSIHGKDILAQMEKKSLLIANAKRNTYVLVGMVFLFGFCWLPHHICAMYIDSEGDFMQFAGGPYMMYLYSLAAHCLAMISTVINPVLYGLLNPEFVTILKKTCSDFRISLRKYSAKKFLEGQSSNSTFV